MKTFLKALLIIIISSLMGCGSAVTTKSQNYNFGYPEPLYKEFQQVFKSKDFTRLKNISTLTFMKSEVYKNIVDGGMYNNYEDLHVELIPKQMGKYGEKIIEGPNGANYLYYTSFYDGEKLIHKKVVLLQKEGYGYAIGNIADLVENENVSDSSKIDPKSNVTIKSDTSNAQTTVGGSYLFNGTGNVAVAISESAMDEAVDAAMSKNYERFDALINTGKLLAVKDGTKIDILDAGMSRTKVRISEGAFSGRVGYVQTEFVKVK